MTDQPKVDPTDLHMSSDHMDMHHAEWQAATTALCTDVAAHGAAFRTAAQGHLANDGGH
ncbi:MAG: hypothetical protein JWR34_1818 [Mycobacterium sp.]|jgi:hypothetical protein|nr:hypothetical protein [Mycobacterium sp.]